MILPLPLKNRKMPKLDQMDLIEQGFGLDLSLYSSIFQAQCQIHKYRENNQEFMMFSEDYKVYLYARRHKHIWLIYGRDPSDSQFDPKDHLYQFIIENEIYKLYENENVILMIKHFKSTDPVITYYQSRVIIVKNTKIVLEDFYQEIDEKLGITITTIPPLYDSKAKRWYLADSDRMVYPSKRNFILGVKKNQCFRMGKIAKGVYTVDYSNPLNFLYAFCIALSTNEFKSR